MSTSGSWLIAIALAWLILAAFWPSKPTWTPFGGVFTRDRKTGAIRMALTLPAKRSAKTRRKR